MSISFEVDHGHRRIASRAESLVTFDVLNCHMCERLSPGLAEYSELLDLSGQTTNMSEGEIHALAEKRKQIAAQIKAGPTAVVATDDVFFGMFRMFDMLTDEIRPLRVFREKADAEAWLDSLKGANSEK